MPRNPLYPLALAAFAFLIAAAHAAPASAKNIPPPYRDQPVREDTAVDHDGRPIVAPAERDPSLWGHLFREAIVEPISHAFDIPNKIIWVAGIAGVEKNQEASNVNAFDEVPNSSWFTNRNHVRHVSEADVRAGSFGEKRPAPPYEVKSIKKKGFNPGFNIKDSAGNRWVVKLDAPGHPRISSGAGVVSGRLIRAAGFNISHDEAFIFRRDELKLDPDLVQGKDGEEPFSEENLDSLLVRGAQADAGVYHASASLFLPGKVVGPFSFRGSRDDDPNDRFTHKNRRELRGLYVFYSWINNWDVKDHQSLDTFQTPKDDSLGHVVHHLLDVNGSLGAAAEGPKPIRYGYEQKVDLGWIAKRFVTLGFVVEPWRRARQETGIPSVGNLESEEFVPDEWRPSQYMEPFRKMTLGDAYWGAKLVASFSDAQVDAAIDAAAYEDPRARAYLRKILLERRDKIARYWFERVAPLDFFEVSGDMLRFHDLAVDRGLVSARSYEIEAEDDRGQTVRFDAPIAGTAFRLRDIARDTTHLSLRVGVAGSHAKPVRVELDRSGSEWVLARVRHG